jgi:hypothetical protein
MLLLIAIQSETRESAVSGGSGLFSVQNLERQSSRTWFGISSAKSKGTDLSHHGRRSSN